MILIPGIFFPRIAFFTRMHSDFNAGDAEYWKIDGLAYFRSICCFMLIHFDAIRWRINVRWKNKEKENIPIKIRVERLDGERIAFGRAKSWGLHRRRPPAFLQLVLINIIFYREFERAGANFVLLRSRDSESFRSDIGSWIKPCLITPQLYERRNASRRKSTPDIDASRDLQVRNSIQLSYSPRNSSEQDSLQSRETLLYYQPNQTRSPGIEKKKKKKKLKEKRI